MPDVRDLLEREGRTVDLAPGDFDRLLGRRERKARERQIVAGAVAVIVVLLTAATLLRSFATSVPATPTPGPPGALAYFAHGDLFVASWDGSDPVRILDGDPGTGDCPDEFIDAGPI